MFDKSVWLGSSLMITQIKTWFMGSACSFLLAFFIAITPATIVKADFYDGLVAFVAQDYLKAFKEFKPAAVQGDAQAQLYMGYLYENGWGVAQDYQLAAAWFSLSVEQGIPDAQYRLAYLYEQGRGVDIDYTLASKLYKLSAEQGNDMAQDRLGFIYYFGLGVPLDYAESKKWYRQSAE